MAKNKKKIRPKKKSVASRGAVAGLAKPRKSTIDLEAIELLRGATTEDLPLPIKLQKEFARKLVESNSKYLRIALAFHAYRFFGAPWTLGTIEIRDALPLIRHEIGSELADILQSLAQLFDHVAGGENGEGLNSENSRTPLGSLSHAVHQLHEITHKAVNGAEREALFRTAVDTLELAGLFKKAQFRVLFAKIGMVLKARTLTSRTAEKALEAIDVGLGKIKSDAIKRLAPVLNALGMYVHHAMPDMTDRLLTLNHVRRHVLGDYCSVEHSEISFKNPEDLPSLGRLLEQYHAFTAGAEKRTTVHLKAALLRMRYSLTIGEFSAIKDFWDDILSLLTISSLVPREKEQIKGEIVALLVSKILDGFEDEEGDRIDIDPVFREYPADYRLCCLYSLFNDVITPPAEFTNFNKEVFIWVASRLKIQKRKEFIKSFYSSLSAVRKREILNSAITFSIYDNINGASLWNAFVGPVLRGEYNDPPMKVSALTEHHPAPYSLAVLWAEYEDDKFGRREVVSLAPSLLVSVTRGIAELLPSLDDLHRRLTGHVLLRRWNEFFPVMYQEELVAKIGQLAFSISATRVGDVIKFLNAELNRNGVTSKLAYACHELSKLPGVSDGERVALRALHKKTAHALKLRIGKAA